MTSIELNAGLTFEYELVEGEQTARGNNPGRQIVRIESVGHGRVRYSFLASDHWLLAGASYPTAEYERFLAARNARVTTFRLESEPAPAVETATTEAAGVESKSLQERCIAALTSGRKLTSEVAASLGKPVAAANSALQALLKKSLVKVETTTNGLTWSL